MANNYDINYNDERFTQVESDKQQALTEVEKTYGSMIDQTDSYYQAQIDASKQWADKQSQLQQENTDFAIEKIEQQKQQAQKDYTKEQSGAYVDWQKQSNQYGANAEQMAMQGMSGTGYSESSQVSMYNTYQNRVASARDSLNKAMLNYDNGIKEAILQNNSALAEISFQALQQQLELSLQGFQYKNNLLTELLAQKQQTEDRYYNRYQDVLTQMNRENELAEQIRQYEQNYALQVKEYEEGIRQFNEEIARLKKKDEQEYQLEIQQLEEQKRQWEAEYKLAQDKFSEEKRQFDLQYSLAKSSSSGGSGGSSGAKISSSGNNNTAKVTNTKASTQKTTQTSKEGINAKALPSGTQKDIQTYGAFSNGYQPKGISGYGAVAKTGLTISVNGNVQNIWKTSDGTRWYWDGSTRTYKKMAKTGGYLSADQQLANMVASNSLVRK
jgi:hypothetical protein